MRGTLLARVSSSKPVAKGLVVLYSCQRFRTHIPGWSTGSVLHGGVKDKDGQSGLESLLCPLMLGDFGQVTRDLWELISFLNRDQWPLKLFAHQRGGGLTL